MSRPPLAPGNLRHEPLQSTWRKLDRFAPLRAHVRRHEDAHHVQSIVEREQRGFFSEKRPHEMPIFRFVAIDGGFARYDGHESHLRVLLFDEILARATVHFAAEKYCE